MEPKMSIFCLDYLVGGEQVYRIALGNIIPSRERKTLTPKEGCIGSNCMSGSVSFADFVFRMQTVPEGESGDLVSRDVLSVLSIGTEPDYRRKGYATLLTKKAEDIASQNYMEYIVANDIGSKKSRNLLEKLGYTFYLDGEYAFKRLERNQRPSLINP